MLIRRISVKIILNGYLITLISAKVLSGHILLVIREIEPITSDYGCTRKEM